MPNEINPQSLESVCAALCYAIGIEPPEHAAAPSPELVAYIDEAFGGKKADRIVMYNPDAVAHWLFEKYPHLFAEAVSHADVPIMP